MGRDESFGDALLFHGGDVASAVRWVKELDPSHQLVRCHHNIFRGAHPVELRVGEHEENFYYDLSRSGNNSVVEIGKDGWRLTSGSPVYFLGTPNMKPQVVPNETGGNLWRLLKHIRFNSNSDKLLYLVYIVSCFVFFAVTYGKVLPDLSSLHGRSARQAPSASTGVAASYGRRTASNWHGGELHQIARWNRRSQRQHC